MDTDFILGLQSPGSCQSHTSGVPTGSAVSDSHRRSPDRSVGSATEVETLCAGPRLLGCVAHSRHCPPQLQEARVWLSAETYKGVRNGQSRNCLCLEDTDVNLGEQSRSPNSPRGQAGIVVPERGSDGDGDRACWTRHQTCLGQALSRKPGQQLDLRGCAPAHTQAE